MTPELQQALTIIDQACSQALLNRQAHQAVGAALKAVADALENPEPATD